MKPSAQRFVIALAALAVLVAYGGQIAHGVVVAHVACAHGAFVHGDDHATEHSAAPTDTVLPGGQDADHAHCDGVTLLPAAVGPVASPPTGAAAVSPVHAGRRSAEHRPVSTLALAPKSSPPVSA